MGGCRGGQQRCQYDRYPRPDLFRQGKKADAIALEEKAAKLSDNPAFQDTLASYKRGELPPAQ